MRLKLGEADHGFGDVFHRLSAQVVHDRLLDLRVPGVDQHLEKGAEHRRSVRRNGGIRLNQTGQFRHVEVFVQELPPRKMTPETGRY
jgi:hypothetical protein